MTARPFVFALVGLALAGGGTLAHHGWGSYDAGQKLTVSSAVQHVAWQNPHVHIHMEHQGATWEAVLAPPFRMDARGLTPALIKAGTRVQVEGYPSTQTPRELRAERITIAGKTYELR